MKELNTNEKSIQVSQSLPWHQHLGQGIQDWTK